jgi:large subunit ribosomal protein L21
MYAVIETGGKQYRVELGSVIRVDRLSAQPGDSITLDRVLLIADGDATAVGQPVVDGATVRAEVLGQERGEKIVVFKYKPKARTRVKSGFRAELTRLRVADIAFAGKSAAEDARVSETRKARAAKEAEKAAAEKAAADQELAARLAASEPPATEATATQEADASEAVVDAAEAAEAATSAAAKPAEASSRRSRARTTKTAAAKADTAEAAPEGFTDPATSTDDGAETRKDD